VLIWYIVGFIGSLVVCLGLVQFIASNSANYAHVNSEKRFAELHEVLLNETAGGSNYALGNTNKLMDEHFHVDYHPQYNQQPEIQGTLQRRNLPLAPHQFQQQPPSIRMRNEGRVQQPYPPINNLFQQQPTRPHTTVGGTLSNVRRNSYHNSLNGSSGWINTLY
jgi:hypothetical protein